MLTPKLNSSTVIVIKQITPKTQNKAILYFKKFLFFDEVKTMNMTEIHSCLKPQSVAI